MTEGAAPLPRASQGEGDFRWRGGGVSRIEGLTDGVFAIALTLLIVSLEVPRDFRSLLDAFAQVPVFLLTYAMLGWTWYLHHRFHRRYGLEDAATITWNLVLLFVVLFYVFPLKFLARALCRMFGIVGEGPLAAGEVTEGMSAADVPALMILYGVGFTAVFVVLLMMHLRAWALREDLGLDERERLQTRASLQELGGTAGVGVASILFAVLFPRQTLFSGLAYCLIGPLHGWIGSGMRRRLREMDAAGSAAGSGPPPRM